MTRLEQALLALAAIGAAAATMAAETINYTYDSHGRLTRVEHSGSVNNGVVTNYAYDKRDNRTSKTTGGAPK